MCISRSYVILSHFSVSLSHSSIHLVPFLSAWSFLLADILHIRPPGFTSFTAHSPETLLMRAMPRGWSTDSVAVSFDEWLRWDCSRLIERKWKNAAGVYAWWRLKCDMSTPLSSLWEISREKIESDLAHRCFYYSRSVKYAFKPEFN